ncbi:MAG: hypothetical protein J5922_01620 [Clostridia bacterium]|nr:hypothetical protein [Clostridia bacterium]
MDISAIDALCLAQPNSTIRAFKPYEIAQFNIRREATPNLLPITYYLLLPKNPERI